MPGPLTYDDLLALWQGATDASYSTPLVQAGEGKGFEVYAQGFAQLALVSAAIDQATQAAYVLPWSGQSDAPASGEAKATVTLSLTRTKAFDKVLVLGAGLVFFQEQQTDWSLPVGEVVLTGRRYTLVEDLVFLPGESGPLTGLAVAEFAGFGYNYPRPASITHVDQPGVGRSNTFASVAVSNLSMGAVQPPPNEQVLLAARNVPDMFAPDHVGQYVMLTAGQNAGLAARMVGYVPPDLSVPGAFVGSKVSLEPAYALHSFSGQNDCYPGQLVIVYNESSVQVGYGRILATRSAAPMSGFRLAFVNLATASSPIAAASSGLSLPQATINVASADVFGSVNVAYVTTSAGVQVVHYTSTNATQLLGCTGGTGTMAAGDPVFTAPLGPDYRIVAPGLSPDGPVAHADVILANPFWFPETSDASWVVLDWAADLGLRVTNALSPTGGLYGTLDAIGHERNVPRLGGEPDSSYRARLARVADVVSPNAVKRALVRVLGSNPYCLREVGQNLFPGFFYDGDAAATVGQSVPPDNVPFSPSHDFYDSDSLVYTVALTSGSYASINDAHDAPSFQERLVHRSSSGTIKATGWLGRYKASLSQLILVRKTGVNVTLAAGDTIVGQTTGAVWTPSALLQPATAASLRFRMWLDYEQFRGYFLVGVPKLSTGDNGFSYDAGPKPANAWDMSSGAANFFDGQAYGASALYKAIYDAVDRVRAGGVGFGLYKVEEPCT